jgi:predicted ATPase
MLTKMRLENFKSWRELDLDLSNITILFGTNSSGKSSVLQSLLLLKQTAMGFDRSLPMNLGGSEQDYVDLGSYTDLVYAHDAAAAVSIHLEWLPHYIEVVAAELEQVGGLPAKLAYRVQWQKPQDQVIVDRVDYDVLAPEDVKVYLHLKWQQANRYTVDAAKGFYLPLDITGLTEPVTIPLEGCYVVPALISQRSKRYPSFPVWSFSSQFRMLMEQVAYLGPLRDYPNRTYIWRGISPEEIGKRGEKTIDLLLESERNASSLIARVSEWLARLELVTDFQIKSIDNNQRFYEPRVKAGDMLVENSLIDVGFGISQVLPVITLLHSAPEDSIVLLEQPELHLHPSAQAHLADLLLEVAEKRNLQLIVESHSEHLLRRLQRRIAEAENKFATPENIRLYFCELENGESKLHPVQVNKYGQIADWPKDFFGDIDGDLEATSRAALRRRKKELQQTS